MFGFDIAVFSRKDGSIAPQESLGAQPAFILEAFLGTLDGPSGTLSRRLRTAWPPLGRFLCPLRPPSASRELEWRPTGSPVAPQAILLPVYFRFTRVGPISLKAFWPPEVICLLDQSGSIEVLV